MKHIFFLMVFCTLSISAMCSEPYEEIKTGDLLFLELPADYDIIDKSYIANSDSRVTIHVAILENTLDGLYVVDATSKYGVDRHPIDTLFNTFRLRSGKMPDMEIKRLKASYNVNSFIENAIQYIGSQYDTDFNSDNDKYYCSELVSLSYLDESGEPLFPLGENDYSANDGSYAKYFLQFLQILKSDNQSSIGIMPKTILNSDLLKSVNFRPFDL